MEGTEQPFILPANQATPAHQVKSIKVKQHEAIGAKTESRKPQVVTKKNSYTNQTTSGGPLSQDLKSNTQLSPKN